MRNFKTIPASLNKYYVFKSLSTLSQPNKRVLIYEVGARDGLQNEKQILPTNVKVQLIKMLADSGLSKIEATAFVSPKWVPQMADHADICKALRSFDSTASFSVLTPNFKGYTAAVELGCKEVAVFTAASEEFCQRNTNCSIDESLKRFEPIMEAALKAGVKVRGYVSTVLGCPYKGRVDPSTVANLTQQLLDMGAYQVSLGDTIGIGTPGSTNHLLDELEKKNVSFEHLAVHFHDTYGQALVNIFTAIQRGICAIDSSVAGLGGCPYAKGATGNVATEDVVYMLNGMGIEHGVDINKLIIAAEYICQNIGKLSSSRAGVALSNSKVK
eukprot:GHVL01026639.1.p1 GENE.GHVL01026639.1~~GHVL01026639.1.p1  ORF type:complete len:339 (+),score=45.82 GHVL01026639.1:36-1019(+)